MSNIPLSCLLFLLITFPLTAQPPAQRPNFIIILTDDQRWDALGHAGNPVIHTPEMDKLAREGVYFRNAFVTTPICAASRASILTGSYERSHGYTFGSQPLAHEYVSVSYPALLKEAGYRTGMFGKLGMRLADRSDTVIFDELYTTEPGGYFRIDPATGGHIHLTDITTEQAIKFIRDTPVDQPFCLSVSYNAAHADDNHPNQYFWPRRLDTLYSQTAIPEPELHAPQYHEALPAFLKKDDYTGNVRYRWRFDTADKYQQMVKGYYRLVTAIDQNLGRIRDELRTLGIDDNTVILLLGDNGYFLGERQLAGKWLMYEESIRVPMILYDPDARRSGTLGELALNIDIAPTILDYAGIGIPEQMQGRSLRDFAFKEVQNWRQNFICEHLWQFPFIPRSEGIRTARYKYFRYPDHPGYEELYDLKTDPKEKHNLLNDPEYASVLRETREILEQQLRTIAGE